MEKLSTESINRFLQTSGKKAARVLNTLGKNQAFMSAIESPVGQELMSDALIRMEGLLDKVIDETATPQEKAEFRALKGILLGWGTKINSYLINIQEINK